MNKLMMRSAFTGIFFFIAAAGLQATATNRYVATNVPGSAYPFDSWEKAGTNLIEVVAVANANNAGDTVFVSNGTYYLTNQINVTNIVLTNFTGDRAKVIINGNYNGTTNRCFYMNHANAIVSGFTITNGYANTNDLRGQGGGVDLYYGTVKDCLITGNRSAVTNLNTYGGGGGINIYYGTADNCFVVGNICQGFSGTDGLSGGGGIAVYDTGVATNCYVAYNVASNNVYGGGVWLRGGKILNCTIVKNSAGGNGACAGGGINCRPAIASEVRNCTVSSNEANTGGGGIYVFSGTAEGKTLYIRNCLITCNRSYERTWTYGAGIWLNSNPSDVLPIIDSCTIYSNRFDAGLGQGGGIGIGSSTTCITNIWNSIIYDNYAGQGGANLYDGSSGKNKTSVVYSCTSPGSGFDITGVVTSRPSFVDAINGNYRLSPDSPCINKGMNRPWMTGDVDYDGNPRIRYGVVDMGAYEYISPGTVYKFH